MIVIIYCEKCRHSSNLIIDKSIREINVAIKQFKEDHKKCQKRLRNNACGCIEGNDRYSDLVTHKQHKLEVL